MHGDHFRNTSVRWKEVEKVSIREDVFSLRKDLSYSEVLNNDRGNIANHYNTHRYRQVLEGNIDSIAFNYLSNIGNYGISDYKTIDYFNKKLVSVKERSVSEYDEIFDDNTIFLKKNVRYGKVNLQSLLFHRMSRRNFIPVTLSFSDFSRCLLTLCDTGRKDTYQQYTVLGRGYGSGGRLYPISVFLLSLNVERVPSGWYRLQPFSKSLFFINEFNNTDNSVVSGNKALSNASFIIFYVVNMSRIYPKYGEMSLVLSLLEAGEMAQIIDLVATSVALGSYQSASFKKDAAQKRLLLDGVTEQVIHSQIVGKI